MRTWLTLCLSFWLAACAATDPGADSPSPFADHLFAVPAEPVDEAIFAPSEAMRRFVDDATRSTAGPSSPRQILLGLFDRDGPLKVTYDTLYTRTAAETFDARAGNCLSLTLMAASLAQLLGVPVRFNDVLVPETWARDNNLLFSSGHVNLTIGDGPVGSQHVQVASAPVTIDFLPASQTYGQRSRAISRDAVVVMYLNNRAAELLAAGRVSDAYWWARRAVERAPKAVVPLNTLGTIYLRHGALAEARAALRLAASRGPLNPNVLFNLAQVLERQGDLVEAAEVKRRLARIESHPPFHDFELGATALQRGDYEAARSHFARELDRGNDYHEVHFGLALADAALGDLKSAHQQLRIALDGSSTEDQRAIYGAKLDRIRKLLLR